MLKKYNKGAIFNYSYENGKGMCVIVSNNNHNQHSSIVTIAPVTNINKKYLKSQPYFYDNNKSNSVYVILCEQIKFISINKLEEYMGQLDELVIKRVDKALASLLDLNVAEKELNASEFIERLDLSLDRILKDKFEDININKSETIVANANTIDTTLLDSIKATQMRQERMLADMINAIISNKGDILDGLNELKDVFNKQNEHLKKVIDSLIGLYSNINEDIDQLSYNGHDIISKRSEIDKKTNKLNLDINHINENKNNSNPISEPKKVVYETIKMKTENLKHGLNLGVKQKTRWENFDYTIGNALAFIDEWNSTTIVEMCNKYKVTNKQLCSRKYLICKYLVSQGITFEIVNKRGRNKKENKE